MQSRQTGARYFEMVRADQWPVADLPLFRDEIMILEGIAEEHPGKAAKLESLISAWKTLLVGVSAKLN